MRDGGRRCRARAMQRYDRETWICGNVLRYISSYSSILCHVGSMRTKCSLYEVRPCGVGWCKCGQAGKINGAGKLSSYLSFSSENLKIWRLIPSGRASPLPVLKDVLCEGECEGKSGGTLHSSARSRNRSEVTWSLPVTFEALLSTCSHLGTQQRKRVPRSSSGSHCCRQPCSCTVQCNESLL
ncbi:hypothetical protein BDZ45DRAFT_279215 [Acephala macrosclerotiorum]|nr:hypothetical protein BDZ45DRAFT_279215 [Acephala macrosclerotiorum]